MTMARLLMLVALLTPVLGLGGCHRAYKPAPNPLEVDAAEYDRLFEASVDVLRDYDFRVDRRDHRFGKVTTAPLVSPTVFEPWINHNTTLNQTAQSTLDNLRRTVTVSLAPSDDAAGDVATGVEPPPQSAAMDAAAAGPYQLRVEVLLENLQAPTRRLNGSVTGSRFSVLSAVPTEWSDRNIAPAYWQPIGRDAHLEDRLARSIVERSLELPE